MITEETIKQLVEKLSLGGFDEDKYIVNYSFANTIEIYNSELDISLALEFKELKTADVTKGSWLKKSELVYSKFFYVNYALKFGKNIENYVTWNQVGIDEDLFTLGSSAIKSRFNDQQILLETLVTDNF